VSKQSRAFLEGALVRFEYSCARLEETFFTKQFTLEDIERKERTGLAESWFAGRKSKRMSAEKIDDEFHRVRELALHGKAIPKGDGYQVGGAAVGTVASKDKKTRDKKSEYQKLHSRFDRLSNLFDRLKDGGGGSPGGKPKPRPKRPGRTPKLTAAEKKKQRLVKLSVKGDPDSTEAPCFQCIADGRPEKAAKHGPAGCWTLHPDLLPACFGGPAAND
jgi:hypothetical protein